MINKQRLISLTQKLIRIDSQNPGSTEYAIARFVREYLRQFGVPSRSYEFAKRRTNVIARILGRNRSRSLLITPHLDTVPAGKGWTGSPFSGKVNRGRIYGLGATDCKGNLAVAMEVLQSLIEDRAFLDYNLIFAATADEECGSALGIEPLLAKKILRPDAAIVLDADDFDIVVAQKGLIHLQLAVTGKKAHGAYPWLGVNAIAVMVDILKDLKDQRFARRANPYLRPPTVNIGTIRGGDKVNIVADRCSVELDFRFLPGMTAKEVLGRLQEIVHKHSRNARIKIDGIQKPFFIAKAHPLVKALVEAWKKAHRSPCLSGSEGATIISFFQAHGIDAVATGFGCQGCAHTVNEYAHVDSLYSGAKALEGFLKRFRFPA